MKLAGLLSIVVLASAIIVFSCKEKESECVFKAPDIVFVGYTEAETDTIIYRRYENNNQFTNLIDTVLVANTNVVRKVVGTDSIVITPAIYPDFNTNFYANNWEIHLPAVNQSVRFSDMTPVFNRQRETGAQCHSYVSSVMVNQQVYNYTSWFGDKYRIYINR